MVIRKDHSEKAKVKSRVMQRRRTGGALKPLVNGKISCVNCSRSLNDQDR